MAENKRWIQEAIQHEGSLTRKARRAGKTVEEFCRNKYEGNSTTARQCRLYRTLQAQRKKRAR